MIIDSHAHYSHIKFEQRFRYLSCEEGTYKICEGSSDDIFDKMTDAGIVGAIEPAIDLASNQRVLDLCEAHKGFSFPAVGVHPTRTPSLKWTDRKQLRKYASDQRVVAIGETGLDYHFERKEQYRLRQFFWFQYQIDLTAKHRLPLVLHIRLAYKDALRVLKWNRRKLHGGVAHCFCGTKEEAFALIELGFCLGISGVLLEKNETAEELREIVRAMPLERILVETDAPYVLPYLTGFSLSGSAKRKIRNTSLILPEVIKKIAELKEMDSALVEETICKNTIKVFGLPEP